MKSVLLGLCCAALMLASCSHKGHTEHSCKACGQASTEKSCANGECSLDKKCEECAKKEK